MNIPAGMIEIDDDRLKHLRGVAKRAYRIAKDTFSWSEDQARQMFIMGFLHDIGYEFSARQEDHAHIGGQLLSSAGYKYAEPVRDHGSPEVSVMSDELFILNVADMQTDSQGTETTCERRLDDIEQRYGNSSSQYLRAKVLVERLYQELGVRKINLVL